MADEKAELNEASPLRKAIRTQNKLDKESTKERTAARAAYKKIRAANKARARARAKVAHEDAQQNQGDYEMTELQRKAYGEQFESVKDLVKAANEGNPSKVLDLLTPIMSNKVTDHLATKKIQIAGDFIGIPPEEGLLDDE